MVDRFGLFVAGEESVTLIVNGGALRRWRWWWLVLGEETHVDKSDLFVIVVAFDTVL